MSVKRYQMQKSAFGPFVPYKDFFKLESDYAALLARHNEAVENGAALSASCCPYQGKGGLWHDERGHYHCGFREKYYALREAVAWERECQLVRHYIIFKALETCALREITRSISAARAAVDALLEER